MRRCHATHLLPGASLRSSPGHAGVKYWSGWTASMAAAILAMCLTGRASADLLVYDLSKHPLYPHALAHSGLPRLNDGDSQFVLPGRVVVMRDINFTHPSGSTAHFSLRDSRHVRSLTAREEFRKYLG